MIELYLIITGLIFFAWLYALVRQTQRGLVEDQPADLQPVVPVNLMSSREAMILAEGRGRIVYANEIARDWFGIDGGAPNLTLMAQMTQPADALHDLLAKPGHASFRLGQRRIEAVSHPLPGTDGTRMVVVMREMTASVQTYTEFDPLRALAILGDISHAVGGGLDLDTVVDAALRSLRQAIAFDGAEVTLWQPDTETLTPIGRVSVRAATGTLIPLDDQPAQSYRVGEGLGGWIAMYRQPLLIGDIASRPDVFPRTFQVDFQSYAGVPLMVADRFVGTLELISYERGTFTQRDIALMQAVGSQVAALVDAARLYRSQTLRVAELSGLQQIAEAMSQLGEIAELYGQLTLRIAGLMGVELCGVLLYDEEERMFRSQPPFYGVPDALIKDYRLVVLPNTQLYSIWWHQPWWYTNDPRSEMIQVMGFEDLLSVINLRSMALVPMIVGARRIGLLLVANKHGSQPFTDNDMRVLMSFASQAAVVAENARLYNEEQRRNRELGGLQQIAQALGVLRSPAELYSQITARIAALMNVQMCGILLYDPATQVLVSQPPFYGMEDVEAVDFYQLPSPPGSVIARLWQDRDTWFSNDVRHDPLLAGSDLAQMAGAMGIRQTALATLAVGGTRLGIIQASNKLDGSEFTTDDVRVLAIFAGQAAMLIDNARLYREMQRRAHEAEGLRAITEIASQVIPRPETIEQVIVAIANVMRSEVVAVALVDENTGELVIDPLYTWGGALKAPYRIDAYAAGFERSVLLSRTPFVSNLLEDDTRVLPHYGPLFRQFGLRNVLQVPMVIQERSIGELLVGNKLENESYTEGDSQLLQSVSTQVTAMVDRMRLYQGTDQDLRARIQELDALSRVNRELSQTIELVRILDVIRQEALRSTSASGVSVTLLTDMRDWPDDQHPVIEQRFGEQDALVELAPVEQAAISRGEVVVVPDYADSSFAACPPRARAGLAVPIRFGDEVVGLVYLYSQQPGVFDRRITDFVLTLTDQAAIAIGNARRYQDQLEANRQLRIRTERMGRIFELGEMFRQGASLAEILEELAHSVQETVGFNLVLISLVDSQERVLRRTAQAGLPLAVFEEMQRTTPPVEQALNLMQDSYRISHSYFLPVEGTAELTANLPVYQSSQQRMGPGPRAWDPQDLLLIPLYGSRGRLVGMMSVDEPRTGRRPDVDTVEALEIFANQAAFIIENYRLIERIQQEAEATRRERDRLAQLHLVVSEIQSATDVPSRLQVVANGIHDAGWGRVVITLRDEHLEPTAMIYAGYTSEEALALSDEVSSGATWRRWINDLSFYDLKLGAGYYLRYNHPWVSENIRQGRPPEPLEVARDAWHPQDVIYLPLVGQDQKRIIGIIAMYDPVDGRVPTEASLQPFELFASQAAAAIETTRLYLETVRAAEQEQRLNEMMEVVSGSLSAQKVLQSIGRGLQQMVPFTRMTVAIYNSEKGQFDMLRALIAPDGSVDVTEDVPLRADNTITDRVFREQAARLYRLQREEIARRQYVDLAGWYDSGERSTLIVPMIAGGQAIGVLHLGSELENAFGFQENQDLIQRLANLSAVALDNARLFEQVSHRTVELGEQAQRLAFLNRVSARLAEALEAQDVYQIVLTELQNALGVQSAGLMLFQDDQTARLVLSTHPLDQPLPTDVTFPVTGNPIAEYITQTRQPLAIEDLFADPRLEGMRPVFEQRNTRAMLIVPFIMGGKVIGTVGLDSATPRKFTETEIELAMTTANQAATAIQKGYLFTETQQRAAQLNEQAQRLALINRISARLAQTLDMYEISLIVLSELTEVFHLQSGGLVLFEDEHTGRLVLEYPADRPLSDQTIPLEGNRSIDVVRQTRKPLASEDVLNDPLFEKVRDTLSARGVRSLLLIPLVVGDRVSGTIGLDSTTLRAFSPAEIELAETIASQVSIAIEKSRLYSETLGLTIFNQAVVESIQQGIVVLDESLNIRRLNRYMTTRYGWSLGAVGQPLFTYRPDYAAFLRQPIAVALALNEPQACYEVEEVGPDGQRSIRNYYVYLMLEGEHITGIVLLVEDVTQRALLEADLNARAGQMEALSEVSSQITSTLDPNQVINLILDALGRVIPYDGVSLWLRATDREELYIVAARGYQDPDSPKADDLIGLKVEIPYSPLFADMSQQAKVINVGDVGAGDPRFPYGAAAIYKNWLGAPLISKGKVVGVLTLEKRETHFYTPLHEQLALTFANQAAVALDNAQLFQETRARALALDEQAQRLALLNRVSLALAQSLDTENIFEIALREAAIALNVSEGAAIQVDHENQLGSVIVEYPRGEKPPQQVFDLSRYEIFQRLQRSLVPLAIEHLRADPLAEDLRKTLRRADVESTLLVPLVVGGNVIGILRLDVVDEARVFSMQQIELAQTIASQAAIAVQNASLFEQASIRTRELETLFESAQATAVTLDLNEVMRRVTIQMLSALGTDACTVFIWDDVNNTLEVRGELSARPDDVVSDQVGDCYPLQEYPLRERALRERELVIVRADDTDLPPGERRVLDDHHAATRVLIPLVVNEISIGLVELESLDPNVYFKAEDIRLARTLASQAAISIENARLQTETRRTVEELYIINDMSAALSSANNEQDLLEVIDLQLPNLTDAQVIYVAFYDGITQMVSFPLAVSVRDDVTLNRPSQALGQDEFSTVIRRKAPLLLAGENLDQVRRSLGIETIIPEARCFLGVPLFAGDEVLGVLAVQDNDDPLAFSHNEQRILTTVGGQLSVAIQGARLLRQTLELAEELEQRVQERTAELEHERQHISRLYQITTELSTSLDMERLLSRALNMVASAVNASQGAILAVDTASDRLYFRAHYGRQPALPAGELEHTSLALDEGLAGWAIQNRQSIVVDDVQQDPRWLRLNPSDDMPRAAMIVPIEANEDILGVLMLYSDQPGAFSQDQLRLVAAAASQVANAMNNAELYSLIRDQAERLAGMLRHEQEEATKNVAILDSVADGVMVSDASGQVIVFNSTAERILGLAADRVLGQPTSVISGLYGSGMTRWMERVDQWMRDPANYRSGEFLEERITLEDGRVISVRLSPVYMGDQFLGTVSVFRDITREVEVDRLKSEFVATVSHELRTPMTSIKGYADLLLLGAAGEVSEQQQRFLETIKQNADRLSILVNDLLDISRIDQGRVELKFDQVDVEDLLRGVVVYLRGRAQDQQRAMHITLDLPEDQRLAVWGDYDKLTQIFNNLADNAFSYTPAGGQITLAARYDEDTDRVTVAVTDTGIGIAPEIADRVFERFFRGDELHEMVMDTPGTGLGLAIVKEYVEIHQGRIWFESEEGQGTTFYVELPARPPAAERDAALEEA